MAVVTGGGLGISITPSGLVENEEEWIVLPVGSIYLSVVSTDPATLLGYGTWAQIAEGKMLVGIDINDTDFDTVRETGGAKTVTLTGAQSGTSVHSHSITDPGHAHTQTTSAADGATTRADASSGGTTYSNVANINSSTTGITVNNSVAADASQAHNNLPPYYVVYIWERTA